MFWSSRQTNNIIVMYLSIALDYKNILKERATHTRKTEKPCTLASRPHTQMWVIYPAGIKIFSYGVWTKEKFPVRFAQVNYLLKKNHGDAKSEQRSHVFTRPKHYSNLIYSIFQIQIHLSLPNYFFLL